jgi:hypothetical protein
MGQQLGQVSETASFVCAIHTGKRRCAPHQHTGHLTRQPGGGDSCTGRRLVLFHAMHEACTIMHEHVLGAVHPMFWHSKPAAPRNSLGNGPADDGSPVTSLQPFTHTAGRQKHGRVCVSALHQSRHPCVLPPNNSRQPVLTAVQQQRSAPSKAHPTRAHIRHRRTTALHSWAHLLLQSISQSPVRCTCCSPVMPSGCP